MIITKMEVHDLRFPTSKDLSGSDAVHKDPDYSCVYLVLHTDSKRVPFGYGLTFTLGRGNEVVAECCKALQHVVVGKNFQRDIVDGMMDEVDHRGFYYQLTQEGQLRWLGPEKGVVGMAAGAIVNAVWDIMARLANKPLWEFIASMEPEELIKFIDFKHIADYVSREEALRLLQRVRPGWESRIQRMKDIGFRAYTTSCGWLGYPENVVRKKCKESLAEGHKYFKMKVGSRDVQDDIKRALWIREEIGNDLTLMMDANQKWNVDTAVKNMKKLIEAARPIWIEEPTNCDDVVGHANIAKSLSEIDGGICGVATGEAAANKIIFKQLLQLKAIRYCQIDSCRVAGVNEILSILLMAAKAEVKVCPHAGGVGLCEYVRHLCMIDFICFNPVDQHDRICESINDSKGYFYDPVVMQKNADGLFYKPAIAPGYAQMKEETVADFAFPHGIVWRNEEKARQPLKRQVEDAKAILTREGIAPHQKAYMSIFVAAIVAAGYVLLANRKR